RTYERREERGEGRANVAFLVPRPSALAPLTRFVLVGLDDPLNQRVPDNVFFSQVNDGDAFDVLEAMDGIDEAGALIAFEVDLRDVAGDDNLRALAHAGEKHLHLSDRRVLALVENDDRVIERAATHEGEWRDFDDVGLHVPADLIGLHHVVEAVN